MKKVIGLMAVLFLTGCGLEMQNKIETLMKDPLKDQHYAQHQQALDDLEHEYLQKQISYTDYEQKKKELEDTYEKEVKMREEKIHE